MNQSIIAVFVLLVANAVAQYLPPTNDTWNYDANGTDWTNTTSPWNCWKTTSVQSPIDITNLNATATTEFKQLYVYQWVYNGYSFLPDYSAAVATYAGVVQYVYQVYGNFGGLYAAEPAKNAANHVVYWQSSNIRFHYPTEHALNGTTYDLEM